MIKWMGYEKFQIESFENEKKRMMGYHTFSSRFHHFLQCRKDHATALYWNQTGIVNLGPKLAY